ncbi:MAG: hypothetical protein H6672_22840 [Anaerolineaceae bacterium]|nr:hypothetical protein [Anaerolineaceae bacterium]
MSTQGLIASLIVTVLTAFWIALPFFRRQVETPSETLLIQKQYERLVVYYERVLTNIRDLDEDHATGKMQTADYEAERESWVQRGVQLLKALDQIDEKHISAPRGGTDRGQIDRAADDAIEAAISAYKQKSAT